MKRYLRGAEPIGKPRGLAGSPVHDAVAPRAAEILADPKNCTSGKQRLTARRLLRMVRGGGRAVGYPVV